MKLWKLAAAVAVALPAACGTALAAKSINLTIISGNNHNFAPVGSAIKAFIPKVNEVLAKSGNYKVSWVQGFGGQVVKVRGELEGVETGLGDLGVVPGPFFSDKLSLYQISYVTPFTSTDVKATTSAMTHLLKTVPAVGAQAGRFNQTVLAAAGIADNYELWTKRKIERVGQLKGIKIGAVGSNIPWVAAIGAVPVTIKGLPTTYNSLKTGIYEGAVLWQQAMAAFKFCEQAPYHMATGFGAVSNALLTVNKDSWKKIPKEVQGAVTEAAAAWSAGTDGTVLGGAKWGKGLCETKYKQSTRALTAKEKRDWAFAMPNIAQQWAKRQDKAALPGTQILKTWMDYMRAHKQVVIRNWDRE